MMSGMDETQLEELLDIRYICLPFQCCLPDNLDVDEGDEEYTRKVRIILSSVLISA
jgi:hypothetical protein